MNIFKGIYEFKYHGRGCVKDLDFRVVQDARSTHDNFSIVQQQHDVSRVRTYQCRCNGWITRIGLPNIWSWAKFKSCTSPRGVAVWILRCRRASKERTVKFNYNLLVLQNDGLRVCTRKLYSVGVGPMQHCAGETYVHFEKIQTTNKPTDDDSWRPVRKS